MRVEKDYRFDTAEGEKSLAELFDGRSQLLVYHFMFGPSYEAGCPVNSSIADTIDGVLPHLHARDVTFLLVSQAPLGQAAGLQAPHGMAASVGLDRTQRLQLRPRLLAHRRGGPAGSRPDDRRRATADRRAQRPLVGHGRRRLSHREPRVQLVRARWWRHLPHVLDDMARIGVPDGLLPDPRPRSEGPRRGRGLAALDPPARRVLPRLASAV